MAEKQFIGKVTEKTFSNGGSIIKLSLNDKDKALLSGSGYTNISIKKSLKGAWYAEIDQFESGASASRAGGNGYTQATEDDFSF